MAKITKLLPIAFILMAAAICTGDDNMLKPDISTLAWLEGDWSGDFEGNPFTCHYSSPEGGVILSISKEFPEGQPCFIEFEKFEQTDSGIVMTPYPNGKQSVPFTLIDYDPAIKKAKFANYEHDFPTEIIYELVEPNKMLIIVAGPGKEGRAELKVDLRRLE